MLSNLTISGGPIGSTAATATGSGGGEQTDDILHDRDVLITGASVRVVARPNASVTLTASGSAFRIDADGSVAPDAIMFTANSVGLVGPLSFAAIGATLTVSGNVATLLPGGLQAATAIVTARIVMNGQVYESNPCAVVKADLSTEAIRDSLAGQITAWELSQDLNERIDLVDAEGTGLVDRVENLVLTYGDTASAASSAADAAQAASDAVAAKAQAILAADGADTAAYQSEQSQLAAVSAKDAAGLSAVAANISASNAASYVTAAEAAATASNTSKLAAESANTAAGLSAVAANISASNAASYVTAAEAAATASNTSKLAAESANTAAGQAANAAVSARDTATTKAGEAGSSASAASSSAATASTKAGEASSAATRAATSESNAAGSASSASTSASNAAQSATSAGGSATAASGSASTASTHAGNAGNSATAANSARVSAESARDAAAGSASAASTSASTASTKADDAGTSAAAASQSANTASTKAGEALSYRNSAAQSAIDAQGYASAAAQDVTAVNARLDSISGTGVTVEQAITANASSITGLNGQYTVKIDNNGYVTGFGLASTSINGAPASSFVINAANFLVVAPGVVPKTMFSVGNVNGVSTIGINGNVFIDGTLVLRKSNGAPILGEGVRLDPSLAAEGTQNSEQTLAALGQNTFRVAAMGLYGGGPIPVNPGLYVNGELYGPAYRSYTLRVINRITGDLVFGKDYDIYADSAKAGELAADLNSFNASHIVIVYSHHDAKTNRLSNGLAAAMYRCGASRSMFGSAQLKANSAYILVGIPGCGEGGGHEACAGEIDNDPNAWCDVGFSVVNGALAGISGASSVGNLVNSGLVDAQQAANDAGIAAAAKLNKNAADTLSGRIAVQANGAFVAGDLAFDANGNRTSGTGTAFNQKGFVHVAPDGAAAVVINAAGVAVKGDVSGSTGTFGAVVIGTTCSFGQTAYDTGNGGWIQGGANPKFSMRSANGKYLRVDVAAGIYQMHGLSITGSAIDSPTITTGFALNLTGDGAAAGPVNSTIGVLFEIAPTGYTGVLSAAWSFTRTSGALPSAQVYITEDSDGLGATFSCTSATNASGTINITGSCRVRHSGGLSHEVSLPISFTFGGAV